MQTYVQLILTIPMNSLMLFMTMCMRSMVFFFFVMHWYVYGYFSGSPAELCWKKAVYCTYFYYIAFENEESLLIHIESTCMYVCFKFTIL